MRRCKRGWLLASTKYANPQKYMDTLSGTHNPFIILELKGARSHTATTCCNSIFSILTIKIAIMLIQCFLCTVVYAKDFVNFILFNILSHLKI